MLFHLSVQGSRDRLGDGHQSPPVAAAQHRLHGSRQERVAEKYAHLVTQSLSHGRHSPAPRRSVEYVVVIERRQVNHLDNRSN
jgi:hypothetical protein